MYFFTIIGEADEGVPVAESDILKNLKQVYQPAWADHRLYEEIEDYMVREKDIRDARMYGEGKIKEVHQQLATLPRCRIHDTVTIDKYLCYFNTLCYYCSYDYIYF